MFKKVLVILIAGLLLFSIMGTTVVEYVEVDQETNFLYIAESFEETAPQMAAYYRKWASIEIPDPFPEDWLDKNGNFKDFVTLDMINEAFHGSVMETFIMDQPEWQGVVPVDAFYVSVGGGEPYLEIVLRSPTEKSDYESIEEDMIAFYLTLDPHPVPEV